MSRFVCRRLTDSLYGGSMPYAAGHVDLLAAAGVTHVVNLCEDAEYWDAPGTLISAFKVAFALATGQHLDPGEYKKVVTP